QKKYDEPSHMKEDDMNKVKTIPPIDKRLLTAILAFALLLSSFLTLPPGATAAQGVSDHTVLYYLIEMQRRVTGACQGRPMPEAPSLTPSEALRAIASESLRSGRSPETMAEAAGLGDTPFVTLTGSGGSPRQILDSMLAGQCASLMGPQYHYVGADGQNGRWVVILAAQEPSGALGQGESRIPADSKTADHAASAPSREQTARGWIDGGEVRYPADRQAEAAPAPSVPVGEMQLDAAGRPIGPLIPLDSSVNAFPPDTFPPEGSDEDTAPATPEATTFVPPTAPGPFGARPVTPERKAPELSGVVPLTDSRPPMSGDSLVYQAPHAQSPIDSLASSMLALVNAERAKGGICGGQRMPPAGALTLNASLANAALAHAMDMAAKGYFSSKAPGGPDLGSRVSATGYVWSVVAENIAIRQNSPQEAVMNWLSVSSQCKNLLDPEFVEAGMARDPSGRYWVFTLATPVHLPDDALRLTPESR
ncbi:CAP domain-containing protein, partial [Desulfovibrio sp. OttesenSCG-928-M14]|nr:CAP domain-containing protein [Desulfovibrio sp. OttesenSCG-928-M14]